MITRRHFLGSLVTAGLWTTFTPLRFASAAGRSDPFRVVFLTDVHAREGADVAEALRRAAKAINLCNPDLIIAGGDLITGGFDSTPAAMNPRWEIFRKFRESLSAPVHAVIGNHDLVGAKAPCQILFGPLLNGLDPRTQFKQCFGLENTYQSFEAGGRHFIILDTIQPSAGQLLYHGGVDEIQLKLLRDDLTGIPRNKPIVLGAHIPLLTNFFADAPPEHRLVNNSEAVLSLFREHTLELVLQGHSHVNEWLTWGSTKFITGGAICGGWWNGSYHGTNEGFGVVEFGSGGIEWSYRDYGWSAVPS